MTVLICAQALRGTLLFASLSPWAVWLWLAGGN